MLRAVLGDARKKWRDFPSVTGYALMSAVRKRGKHRIRSKRHRDGIRWLGFVFRCQVWLLQRAAAASHRLHLASCLSLGHPGPHNLGISPKTSWLRSFFPRKLIDRDHKLGAHWLCLDKCSDDIQPKFEIFGMFADDSIL